ELLDFKKAAAIYQRVDEIVHVERLILRFWYYVAQGAVTGRWSRFDVRRLTEVILGHITEIVACNTYGVLFVLGQKVAKAGDATVHTRATHLFERDLLTSNHLRHARGP